MINRAVLRPLAIAGAVVSLLSSAVGPARAEEEEERGVFYSIGPHLHLNFQLDAGVGAFSANNTAFGIGSTSFDETGPRRGSRRWFEGFVKPQGSFQYNLGDETGGMAYGRLSAVGAGTWGDGDAANPSATSNHPTKLALEDAALGWQSGFMFEALGDNAFDVSLGRQSFSIGDAFLIADGTADGVGRAATYLGPRTAFKDTAIFRVNTAPVRADFFHLRSVTDQGVMRGDDNASTQLYGANVEWFESSEKDHGRFEYGARKRYAGLTAIKVYKADSDGTRNFSFAGGDGTAGSANRDGLQIYSARFGGALIPAFDDFQLFGEYAIQRNNESNRRVRANAWYIQPQYTFAELPWTPRISYRYAHFSGDGDTTDTTDRSWDQFFTATGDRGIGTWSQGEIYSQWTGLGNSNLNAHQVHLRLTPFESTLEMGVVYYRFNFDKPGQTAGVTAKPIMDEINVYAEWSTPLKGLTLVPTVGLGIPRAGLKQALGTNDANDRRFWLLELVGVYKF